MNTQTLSKEMKNKFSFQGLPPDRELEGKANLKLTQLLALAPPGSEAFGRLEISGKSYHASIAVRSAYRIFTAEAYGFDAMVAVNRALERLENQLYHWRFGSGTGNSGPRQSNSGVELPWARIS